MITKISKVPSRVGRRFFLPAYVHAKGFESEQMEQMILQYVKAHGKVTRQEAMDLCRINENQATYLLKKLVKSGNLQRVGLGRTAGYQSLNSEYYFHYLSCQFSNARIDPNPWIS